MEQVLPFEELNINPKEFQYRDISEFTAEEYLAWVRYEAENCPQVVRANIDTNSFIGKQTQYMPQTVDISQCSEVYLPDNSWVDTILDSFSELRLLLTRLSEDTRTRERKTVVPPMKQEKIWRKFCLGINSYPNDDDTDNFDNNNDETENEDEEKYNDEENEENKNNQNNVENKEDDLNSHKAYLLREFGLSDYIPEKNSTNIPSSSDLSIEKNDNKVEEVIIPIEYPIGIIPTTSLMLQFDQVLTQRLIGYHLKWQEKRVVYIQSLYKKRLEELSSISDLESNQRILLQWNYMINLNCKWIFSLFVRLEKPLYQDVAADIREIYRLTCRARTDLETFVNTFVQFFNTNSNTNSNSNNNGNNNGNSMTDNKDINNLNRHKNKVSNSKGSVRFIGIQDDDHNNDTDNNVFHENDNEKVKKRGNNGNNNTIYEYNSSNNINNPIYSIDDLYPYSFELSSQAETYLAGINTIIIVCGKYFGQEEEYEVKSDFSGYEDEDEEEDYEDEDEDEEEGEDDYENENEEKY